MMKPLRFFIMALLCAVANLAWGDDMTGTITFGSASGSTNINKPEVAGNDNLNNKWTITTVFSGTTTSFTPQPGYAQVGSSNNPATSITFTTTLPESQTITAFEAKFGGFSNTAGDIELKVNNTVVGSGSLNGSRDVTVISTTQEASGTVLTVTVTNIDKGVKCYYIKYSYTTSTSTVKSPTFSPAGNTYTEAQNVAISSATEGATIYYTTDSSDPKTSETRSIYSEPVFVSKSGTQIQAYAEYGTMEPSPVVSANYIIKPETPTLSAEGNTVTITTDQENLTYYYNTGTSYNDTDNPDENSTEYNRPIEMSKSAYFKAIAYDQYGNPSGIKSFDFKYSIIIPHPKNINSNYYVKITSASELENGDAILIVSEKNSTYYAMGVTQNDNNRAAETVTVKNNAITISNEKVQKIVFVDASENNNLLGYFYVGNGYLYAAGGNGNNAKNYLRTESVPDENNNAKAKIEFSNDGPTVTFQGTSTRNIIKFNSSNVPPIFSCYASGQTDIQIYKEVDKPFVLTINPKFTDGNGNYFATISNLGYGNFVVPAGLEVSTITIENRKINKTTSFDKDKVIPGKDVAYYVVASVEDASAADALTFEFEPTTDAVSNNLEGIDNWLYPAIAGEIITAPNSDVDYLFYKLTTKNGKNPGFYWGAADGEPFTFTSEHKAYLAVPQVDDNNAGLSSIAIDDTNGINDIENANEQSDEVYTISGVRVKGNLSKGVYIVNGKKQIVK